MKDPLKYHVELDNLLFKLGQVSQRIGGKEYELEELEKSAALIRQQIQDLIEV